MEDTKKPLTVLLVTVLLAIAARLGLTNIPTDVIYSIAGSIVGLAAYFIGRKHGASIV